MCAQPTDAGRFAVGEGPRQDGPEHGEPGDRHRNSSGTGTSRCAIKRASRTAPGPPRCGVQTGVSRSSSPPRSSKAISSTVARRRAHGATRSPAGKRWPPAHARAALGTPAWAPNAANRAGTSAAELACNVAAPPSWPVLRAASSSMNSAPRNSPTTSRSGRMRSAWRTSSAGPIAPAPFDVGAAPDQPHEVPVREHDLGRVFDQHDPFGRPAAATAARRAAWSCRCPCRR